MKKDNRMLQLVGHLENKFGANSFMIRDHWEGDQCALGFSDVATRRMLYVSTSGRQEGRFFLSVEDITDPFRYEELARYENADLEALEQVFRDFILLQK